MNETSARGERGPSKQNGRGSWRIIHFDSLNMRTEARFVLCFSSFLRTDLVSGPQRRRRRRSHVRRAKLANKINRGK